MYCTWDRRRVLTNDEMRRIMINSISFTAVAFIYHTTERHQDPSERSAKTQRGSWHLVQRPPHSIMGAAAKRPACVSHHPARRVGPRHAGNYLQGNARSFWIEKHSSFSFDARFFTFRESLLHSPGNWIFQFEGHWCSKLRCSSKRPSEGFKDLSMRHFIRFPLAANVLHSVWYDMIWAFGPF